uniref:Uncharacterized protein n=1 Tax=Anguilla anguilla TaxID=7936 RepID=A0A0E9VIL9_ANGAN
MCYIKWLRCITLSGIIKISLCLRGNVESAVVHS